MLLWSAYIYLGYCIIHACGLLSISPLLILPARLPVYTGDDVMLTCRYSIPVSSRLYAVKWYRGQHEFYRYTPNQWPAGKAFPLPGVQIKMSSSNAHQVTLLRVPAFLSGNFTCEVSEDAPTFTTESDTRFILIIDKPEFIISDQESERNNFHKNSENIPALLKRDSGENQTENRRKSEATVVVNCIAHLCYLVLMCIVLN